MSTLPLYWKLSSTNHSERIDASVELIKSLEQFQLDNVPQPYANGVSHSGAESEGEDSSGVDNLPFIDSITSEDVRYALRRLTRGLASPKESARLGFAVALTELLSRLPVVTSNLVLSLVWEASEITGSMRGQQLRDQLFARLFGLNCLVQSGLLFKTEPLPSSSIAPSSLKDFQKTLLEYISLGEKKTWLRETAWWSLIAALEGLYSSQVPWKDEAVAFAAETIFTETLEWSPEKIATTVKMQQLFPALDWRQLLRPTFKDGQPLSPASLARVSAILKASPLTEMTVPDAEDEKDLHLASANLWKPEPHFAWDVIIDSYCNDVDQGPNIGPRKTNLIDFFRVAVDESLFASSSPERKFWGFKIFGKILPRLEGPMMPQLFTKNFMLAWERQTASKKSMLYKAATSVVDDIRTAVEKNPNAGIHVVLSLLGTSGGSVVKINRIRTISSILGSMEPSGVKEYVDYLIDIAYNTDPSGENHVDAHAVESKRIWVAEQLARMLQSPTVPRGDAWVHAALQFLALHGFFRVKKKNESSNIHLLHRSPATGASDKFHASCRERLYACLAHLSSKPVIKVTAPDGQPPWLKSSKDSYGAAHDGDLWLFKVVEMLRTLEQDERHVSLIREELSEDAPLRKKARKILKQTAEADVRRPVAGFKLLLLSYLLRSYDEDFEQHETFSDVLEAVSGYLESGSAPKKKTKRTRKPEAEDEEADLEPIDVIVDALIGDLESGTAFQRDVSNIVFDLVCTEVKDSTVELLLTQVEPRDPTADNKDDEEDEDIGVVEDASKSGSEEEDEEDEGDKDDETAAASETSSDEDGDEEMGSDDEGGDVDPEFRRRVAEALQMEDEYMNGDAESNSATDSESDVEMMDDDQMMALDEKLAEIFRQRANELQGRKGAQREASLFKIRVVDFISTFIQRNPSSNYTIRTILPLVDLATFSGRDEAQLSKKATGVITNHIGQLKEYVPDLDVTLAKKTLQDVHVAIRRSRKVDIAAIFNPCCHYLLRNLSHAGHHDVIEEVYSTYLDGVFSRKWTSAPFTVLQYFFNNHSASAWGLREKLLEYCKPRGVPYIHRQLQAYELVRDMTRNHTAPGDETLAFLSSFASVICETLTPEASPDTTTMNAQQIRDLLRHIMAVGRKTISGDSAETMRGAWNTDDRLSDTLSKLKDSPVGNGSRPLMQALIEFLRLLGKQASAKKVPKEKPEAGAKAATERKEGKADKKKDRKRKKRDGEVDGVEDAEERGASKKRKRKRDKEGINT